MIIPTHLNLLLRLNVENIEIRRFQYPFSLAGFLILAGLAGLVTVASAGTEEYDYEPLGHLIHFISPQRLVTRYTYDGVGNIRGVQRGLQPQPPVIGSVSPAQIRRGAGQQITQITIVSDETKGIGVTAPDANFSISGLQTLDKQIKFLLGASEVAQLGANTLKLTGYESSSNFTITVNASPVIGSVSPSNHLRVVGDSRCLPVADQSSRLARLLRSSPCSDGNCAHMRRVIEQLPLELAVPHSIFHMLLLISSSISPVALVSAPYRPPKAI